MGVTAGLVKSVLDFLLPAACLSCDTVVPAAHLFLGLCPACSCRLSRLSAASCGCCGQPIIAAALPRGFRCGDCRTRPPAFDRLHAVWSYTEPFDAVIRGLKFRRLEYLGEQLAEELYIRLPRLAEAELVVPVPLHWARELERGYNQAERIARPLARRIGVPLVKALLRRRRTRPQTSLDRTDRIDNLRGAFRPRNRRGGRGRAIDGRTVILVDDVVTTGATLDAASRSLKEAGATRVLAVAAGIRI